MLTESFVTSVLTSDHVKNSSTSAFKDVGICLHELQPHLTPRQSYKKSSTPVNCLAISENHIFAAQSDKAVIHVYSREKGNQEATVPFPERIHSLAYAGVGTALLVIGTAGGKVVLWELASGRQVTSAPSHLQAVSSLLVTDHRDLILSGSADSNIHVWSLPNLISFSQPSALSSGNALRNVPLRTFSNHRSGVTALSCGHSTTATNFAVSASSDSTCYIWSLQSCEVLRVVLLPSTPLCFQTDPADRAVYAGYENGSIQCIDVIGDLSKTSAGAPDSIHNATSAGPVQLEASGAWSGSSSDIGSTQCLCLSYDGTSVLSGHSSGKILSWDVAKGRIQKTVIDFGQSVTNLIMLRPDGLPCDRPIFQVRTITKPKLEYSTTTNHGSTGIPASYVLQGQIIPRDLSSQLPTPPEDHQSTDDFDTALTSPFFSQSMIDEAVRDLDSASQTGSVAERGANMNHTKLERLEEQIAKLNGTIQQYASAAESSRARRMARVEMREGLGHQKRSAYFEAKGKGQDGDKAMEEWEERERQVDLLSDEEEMTDAT